MKLATLRNQTRDGRLAVVSRDLTRAIFVDKTAATMQQALDDWDLKVDILQGVYEQLNAEPMMKGSFAFDQSMAMAPLPRSSQFVDASAFLNHGKIMEQAYQLNIKKTPGIPILVQRQSDDFVGARDDYYFPNENDNGDFEGEFAVIVGDVVAGSSAEKCESKIRLVTIINDVSMRAHLFRELSMGFGLIQAKPATVFAPVAVTLDELGDSWRDGRIHLDMVVHRNGELFGHPNGVEMDWGFGELLAHLAYNRNLRSGCILGSGTVSNSGYRKVGSACLAERRAVEKIDTGESQTPFIEFNDILSFECFDENKRSIFGRISNTYKKST